MAAVRLWGTLLTGMMSSGKSLTGSVGEGAPDVFSTEFSMHQASYYFMVWSSLTLGGIMVIEQYFGRRIFCFMPANNTQPAATIGEYCWQHGNFEKSQSNVEFYMKDETWIMHSFIYFFIRSAVFVLPHLIWQIKYEAWVVAVIKGSLGLVKQLQVNWFQFSEVADKAYNEYSDLLEIDTLTSKQTGQQRPKNRENMQQLYENVEYQARRNQQHHPQPNPLSRQSLANTPSRQTPQSAQSQPSTNSDNEKILHRNKLYKTYNAVMAMTRDVVEITKKQIPHYTGLCFFMIGRMVYDVIVLLLFSVMDLMIFRITNQYDSTDFYCMLPTNPDKFRCVMPMLTFQWYATFLAMISSIFMLFVTLIYTIHLMIILFSPSTKDTFLDHIPFSEVAADVTWHSCTHRKTYKLLSKFMMQNICILYPLNFLESFVDHMKENHQVGEDILARTERDGIQMIQFRQVIGNYDTNDSNDGDDALWRLMAK